MKITICGSIAHYERMLEIERQLVELGHDVYVPELREDGAEYGGGKVVNFDKFIHDHGGPDAFPPQHDVWKAKGGGIRDHFEKIEWCDAILVTNYEKRGIDGYVGGNTLIEIGTAFYLKKQIYILNPISSKLSYRQEIYGMQPVFLEEDLLTIY